MLGLYPKGFHFPVLMIVDSGKRAELSALKVALVVDVASKIIEDPLNRTRVRKERETVLERQSVS